MGFNPNDYEDVNTRLHRFYETHPKGRITSDLVHHNEDFSFVVFKAYCFREGDINPAGTGWAYEMAGTSNVNKTSHIENCETSAVGRALANAGFSPKGSRPTREEMGKAAAGMVAGEIPAQGPSPRETPATACPSCGGPIFDNTNDPNRGRRPLKKCKNTSGCGWVLWPPKSASEGGGSAQLNTESSPSTDQVVSMKGVEGEASNTELTQAPPDSPPPVEPQDVLALGSWDEVKKACRVVLLQLIASGQRKDDRIPARMDQLANLTPEELGLVAAHLKAKVSA